MDRPPSASSQRHQELLRGDGNNQIYYFQFVLLWRVFLTLLQQSMFSQIVYILDGLDECKKESLRQLLDTVGNYLSKSWEKARLQLKLITLSRPQPAVLESKLG